MSPKLIQAINEACDWLCDAPEGTDQRERGDKLKNALNNSLASEMLRKRNRAATRERKLIKWARALNLSDADEGDLNEIIGNAR